MLRIKDARSKSTSIITQKQQQQCLVLNFLESKKRNPKKKTNKIRCFANRKKSSPISGTKKADEIVESTGLR